MMPLRILIVCTGNVCRSPLTEVVLRHELRDVRGVETASAGTHALIGRGMEPENIAIARERGYTGPFDHSARQITEALLREAGLILALDRGHRRRIVELAPAITLRTFTLREFAHLAKYAERAEPEAGAPDQPLADAPGSFLSKIRVARQTAPCIDPARLDVIDPYLRGRGVFERQAEQILPAVTATSRFLRDVVLSS